MGVAQYTSGYDSTENDAFQTVARQNPITSAEWKEGERRPLTHGQINTKKRKEKQTLAITKSGFFTCRYTL